MQNLRETKKSVVFATLCAIMFFSENTLLQTVNKSIKTGFCYEKGICMRDRSGILLWPCALLLLATKDIADSPTRSRGFGIGGSCPYKS